MILTPTPSAASTRRLVHSRRVSSPPPSPAVVIVGGGISGLAAAFFLRDRGLAVTVLEGSPRLGGKLAVSEIAGIEVDEGAEALLARRPEGTDLIGAVGLAGELVSPGTTAAAIWTRGGLRPLPRRQLMGVPADLSELDSSGILSAPGLARAREDLRLPPTPRDGDVPVASYVGARFGQEVVDRLVDPLLGGVYAGRSRGAVLRGDAGRPGAGRAAASLARRGGRVAAARPRDPVPARRSSPRWRAASGTLPAAVAAASGAAVRTGAMARELARRAAGDGETAGGWRLTIGPTRAPERLDADAVILAVPARPASRLLVRAAGCRARRGSARRDRLREHGHRDAGLPARRVRAPAGGQRLPGPRGRRARGQGGHVQHGQVAAPAARPTPAWTSSGARSAGSVRRRCCSATTPSWPGWPSPTWPPPPGCAARPPPCGSPGGAAGCPSTRWATCAGSRGSAPRSPPCPGWRSAGPPTTAIGIPACIASARLAADQVLAYLESPAARPARAG